MESIEDSVHMGKTIYKELLILSDIHGNMEALKRVLSFIGEHDPDGRLVLLGDLIDYGQHSNEVIAEIRRLAYPVLCNIRGNHEDAVIRDDYARFSSDRGRECARHTRTVLNEASWQYITEAMSDSGRAEFEIAGKRCLAVHGSLEDIYWKSIRPGTDLSAYREYDYVFSGHSHLPHFFEVFFDADDPVHRNKKKTVFLNPGSVGQPRNLNPMAQFAVLDTGTGAAKMVKIPYDIAKEQAAFTGQVNDFYRKRLEAGV